MPAHFFLHTRKPYLRKKWDGLSRPIVVYRTCPFPYTMYL